MRSYKKNTVIISKSLTTLVKNKVTKQLLHLKQVVQVQLQRQNNQQGLI